MRSEGETVVQLVNQAIQSRRKAEARQVAKRLIQGHVDSDRRVINLQGFSLALVQALRAPAPREKTMRVIS